MQESEGATTSVLVLGATGMLGHTVIDQLARRPDFEIRGAARSLDKMPSWFADAHSSRIITGFDVHDEKQRSSLLDRVRPDLVLNAIGVIKQDPSVGDVVGTIATNALLPHLLGRECVLRGIRLVHVSTDCVFSGERGLYSEADRPDPVDLYGRSKLLGEVDAPSLTLRTSIIGHELRRHDSLLDWFLRKAPVEVRGYTRAIYSGVTTVEFARLLAEVVVPHPELTGLWHVASEPITKYDLLRLIAEEYSWPGAIAAYDEFVCDRSMIANRLAAAVGYRPPSWPDMVREMRRERRRAQNVDRSGGDVS